MLDGHKIYHVGKDVDKCPGCNWNDLQMYAFARSQEDADDMFAEGEAGLCSTCIVDIIVNEGYTVVQKTLDKSADIW